MTRYSSCHFGPVYSCPDPADMCCGWHGPSHVTCHLSHVMFCWWHGAIHVGWQCAVPCCEQEQRLARIGQQAFAASPRWQTSSDSACLHAMHAGLSTVEYSLYPMYRSSKSC
jgi:hypothetical protein